jgi:sulfoxide reductase heme-binding subunit YedZ
MTSNQRNWEVFFAAAGVTTIFSAAYLFFAGVNDESIRFLLRLSARIAFLVLLVIFVARPLQQLLATPATARLLKNRRLLGVAFAGIHTAHLALILYRADQVPDGNFSALDNLPGIVTYLVIYLMLISSFDAPARAIGRKAWKILHKVGLYFVFGVFLQMQLPRSLDNLAEANWWFIAVIAVAIVIRLAAFFAKRR